MPAIDNGILLVGAVLLAAGVAAAIWHMLKRLLPEATAREWAALAAAIRAQLGSAVTEERVKLLAGFFYDQFGYGSKYVDREKFCQLVWELVQQSMTLDEAMAISAASMPVDLS